MSWVQIWVHLVFSTKNRTPYLQTEVRRKMCRHIIENCKEKNIYLQSINGWTDHLHCLVSLGKEQSIAQVAQLIKGESSYWLNHVKMTAEKFQWQNDYWAVSVSEKDRIRIENYIKKQEAHHGKQSFIEEIKIFEKHYGFQLMKDGSDSSSSSSSVSVG
ncbi:IS200/IS605 family transposase [Mariniflexile sp.]|uniref:IS200/IS605 family transposase n=1 Tax=Mariniflexile sp. TaxID=1979402 RepID=UPI0040479C80